MNLLKNFNDLRKKDVTDLIEKKGNLSYLSWAFAVDLLLQEDPSATWDFQEPKVYGQTMMVFCSVSAFGKTMRMHLPVMDNRNNAIINPDARKVNDAMMRCLAKCIACFGIGLYIYTGEDLPDDDGNEASKRPIQAIQPSNSPGSYRIELTGKYYGKKLHEVPPKDLEAYIVHFEKTAAEKQQPVSGKTKLFIEMATAFLNQGED